MSTIPINEETFSGVLVSNSKKNTPTMESGAAEMITSDGKKARN